MVTITVEIDRSCQMARVDDGRGNGMEGNFWDFHNGCHGMYHLSDFNSIIGLVAALEKFHKKQGEDTQIVRANYCYRSQI